MSVHLIFEFLTAFVGTIAFALLFQVPNEYYVTVVWPVAVAGSATSYCWLAAGSSVPPFLPRFLSFFSLGSVRSGATVR